MTIDIITYTEEQFARLNGEQLNEVRKAQVAKNRLFERLQKEKADEKYKLVKAGIFRSGIWDAICS